MSTTARKSSPGRALATGVMATLTLVLVAILAPVALGVGLGPLPVHQ